MKSRRILILCSAMLAIVFSQAEAQDKDQIPIAPYLAHIPVLSHWTITLKYPSNSPPKPGAAAPPPAPLNNNQPVSIDIVKGGNVSLMTYTLQNGTQVSLDRSGTNYFMHTPTGLRMFGGASAVPFSYTTEGFLFAEWVRQERLSAYKGFVLYQRIKCFHYQNPQPPNPEGYDPNYGEEAWIDVKTMLPVAAKQNGVEAAFQFHDAPDAPPQLPRDEAAMFQARENAVKALSELR
jgi:hypothetical protein